MLVVRGRLKWTKTLWTNAKNPWELISPPGTIFGVERWDSSGLWDVPASSEALSLQLSQPPKGVGGGLTLHLTQVLLLLLHHWVCFRPCKKATSYLWSTSRRPAYFKSCCQSLWQRCSSLPLRKQARCLPELCLSRLINGGQMKLPMTQYISEKAPGSQG